MAPTDTLHSVSPADPRDEIGAFPVADEAAVDAAVARARAAFAGWRDLGFEARAAILRRFRDLAAERGEELARLVAREVGKALWDARGEARLVPAKVDVTLDAGMRAVATMEAGPGARATFHPRGVLAVLGPFNFPAHLPNGHLVPALATGNTVVFKPSDLAPAVGAWLGACLREAGVPPGVFEVVQGGAATGHALAVHPDVDGVLFTGSYAVGRALEEATLDQPGKILALEMGGKNAVVVLDDADLELAVAETAVSICATTGQRCSCASRLFVHEGVIDAFAERLAAVLRGVKVGMPLDEDVFMGPLVSRRAFEKVQGMLAPEALGAGERVVSVDPGRPAPWVGPGLVRYATSEQRAPYQREEIFGPEAALHPVRDLDEAIAAVNDSDYGLVASVFTRDRTPLRPRRGAHPHGAPQLEPRNHRRQRQAPLRRARPERQRPAGGHQRQRLLHGAPVPPGERGGLRSEEPAARDAEAVSPSADRGLEASGARRTILMGDPSHFSVKGGANPHTRTRWGTRRQVDRELAIRQWHRLKDTLEDLGVRVIVVPPDPDWPGLVYPANAGFQSHVDRPEPRSDKLFTLANLLPTRAGEKAHYRAVLAEHGFPSSEIDSKYRFEGEADFFPAGDVYLLTHGTVVQPALRARPSASRPGSASTASARTWQSRTCSPRWWRPMPIVKIGLTLEAHYHGDTVLCAFGPGRRYLLGYRRGVDPGDWKTLEDRFGESLIALSEPDARQLRGQLVHLHHRERIDPRPARRRLRHPPRPDRRARRPPPHRRRLRVPQEGRRKREVHDRGSGVCRGGAVGMTAGRGFTRAGRGPLRTGGQGPVGQRGQDRRRARERAGAADGHRRLLPTTQVAAGRRRLVPHCGQRSASR